MVQATTWAYKDQFWCIVFAWTFSGASMAMARDEWGFYIDAASWFVPHVVSASMVEALAIRNGFFLASHLGCNKIVIESDRLRMIEAMRIGRRIYGSCSLWLKQCKSADDGWSNANQHEPASVFGLVRSRILDLFLSSRRSSRPYVSSCSLDTSARVVCRQEQNANQQKNCWVLRLQLLLNVISYRSNLDKRQ